MEVKLAQMFCQSLIWLNNILINRERIHIDRPVGMAGPVRVDGIAGNGLRARSVNAIGERRRNEDAIVKNEARTGNFNCVIVGLIRPRESREILSTSSPFGLPEASV